MGESIDKRRERIRKVIQLLKKAYPNAKIALHFKNPWELLVSVILSAQCTDVMVNKVTERVFAKYKTFDAYLAADPKVFEQDIKSTGFYHNKAKNILAAARMIKETFGGRVPDSMERLLTLPGVARKTANVALGNAFGVVEGIAVDTHVHRLSQRLRMVDTHAVGGKKEMTFTKDGRTILDYKKDADLNKIEQGLMVVVPKVDWFPFTYLMIDHGRAVCKAQRPDCKNCVLNMLCPASRVEKRLLHR